MDQVLCGGRGGGPSFCFVLFFHTYVSSKIDEITLFRYKAQNEAKKKKKERKNEEEEKEGENFMYKKKSPWACHGSPGPKYVLILDYRRLSHLLKIHFLNIFDVMSSLIHIHIITFHDLYHADCIVLFLIASKIIQ